MEALYQEYLKEKLDLVFNINSDEIISESKEKIHLIRMKSFFSEYMMMVNTILKMKKVKK